MTTQGISVVVCTRNRSASLARLLTSMQVLDVPAQLDWEVVVVDNGSSDGTRKVIRRFKKRLPLRPIGEPTPGLGHARNAGLQACAGRHTIWIDDDATVPADWLSVYERAFRYWPDVAFFGGPISAHFEGEPPSWIGTAAEIMPEVFSQLEPTDEFVELGPDAPFFPFGANMAFRAGALETIRFDTALSRQPGPVLRGGDEIQVMKRIVREGGTGLWLPPARIEHWIDPARQTTRHVYDHAFGDGFVDEMHGNEVRAGAGADIARELIDESFDRIERELSGSPSDPRDWLPRLERTAIEDGRKLAWSLIPGHHRCRRTRSTRPLLVLGLDGFEVSVAERLIAEGALPNLAALRQRSARYSLDHGDALLTGLAWEHFSTGRSPDDSGRYSAVDLDLETYRVHQGGTRSPTFLDGVNAHTVVFDVPYFDLARTKSVSGITSWGAHDPGTLRESRPATLAAEIESRFAGYPGSRWIYGFVWPDEVAAQEMADRLEESADLRTRICRWLLTERFPEWDLALVTGGELHSAIEALWHGIDAEHPLHGLPSAAPAGRGIRAVYEATDRMVGELREARPDADLVLFSMHGMGKNRSDVATMLLLPELLFRDAFGVNAFTPSPAWKPGPDGRPMLGPGQDWSVEVNDRVRIPTSALHDKTAERPASNLDFMPAARYQPAWPLMDAFALPSFYDGRIRINLVGRERHGRVPLDQYDSCCRRLTDLLMNCRDVLTGERIVDEVVRCERADPLHVDPTDYDLSIRWSHAALGLVHPELGTIGPAPQRRTGGHGGPGVAWIAAEGVVPGDQGVASSFDVVPTLLEMLGERVSGPISGRPLSCIGRRAETCP